MSQQKVEARKELKKNRKQIIAKQKRIALVEKIVGYLVVLCLVVGIGFSVYKKVNPTREPNANEFSYLTATDTYGILTPSIPDTEE